MERATGGVAPVLVPTEVNQPWARPNVGARGKYESTMVSPGAHKRECCPYLFQRGMLVSDEGVRGGQDHLRSDEVGRGLLDVNAGVEFFSSRGWLLLGGGVRAN